MYTAKRRRKGFMMKTLNLKKIVIAMAITLVVAVLPAAGINKVLAETAKTEETAEKKPEVKKASDKKKETKKEETKKVSDKKEKNVNGAKAEEQPASTVQAQSQVASQQTSSSSTTYGEPAYSEPAHNVNEPIQGSIQVEQIPETPSDVQETTTTPSSGIQVEAPAPAPSQPNGTEGVHQQPTVVVDEVVELN